MFPSLVARWLQQSAGPAGPAHPTRAAPQHRRQMPSLSTAASLWATLSAASMHKHAHKHKRTDQDLNQNLTYLEIFLIKRSVERQSGTDLRPVSLSLSDCLQTNSLQMHPGEFKWAQRNISGPSASKRSPFFFFDLLKFSENLNDFPCLWWITSQQWDKCSGSVTADLSAYKWTNGAGTSCMVRSEKRMTKFSSTLTMRPVSPSYRPAITFTWSPIRKYFLNSWAGNSRGSCSKTRT